MGSVFYSNAYQTVGPWRWRTTASYSSPVCRLQYVFIQECETAPGKPICPFGTLIKTWTVSRLLSALPVSLEPVFLEIYVIGCMTISGTIFMCDLQCVLYTLKKTDTCRNFAFLLTKMKYCYQCVRPPSCLLKTTIYNMFMLPLERTVSQSHCPVFP